MICYIVAYHLLSLYESYSHYYYYFFSVWILGPWYLKNRINNHVQIFTVSLSLSGLDRYKLFSVITQPWRHPGAILCFDVIIDIFISIYHKLTKFNTHKLQVIRQHTDNPCPCARHDARVKILTCSKSPINNFEHEPGHLEHFQIFRPYVSARTQREWMAEIQNFHMIWIPDTTIDDFHWFSVTLDLS